MINESAQDKITINAMFKRPLYCLIVIFLSLQAKFSSAQEVCARYISLTPATTEILFALGLDKEIVGVSAYCNYPEKVKSKEKVGTFSDINIEKIIVLRPDIIFATGLEQAPAVGMLKNLGLNVIVCDPKSIEELIASIELIGISTGKKIRAYEITSNIRQRIKAITQITSQMPDFKKPKVFIEIWHEPVMTAGPGSLVDELIAIAGGRNIAYDAPRAYSRFSNEAVIERNPDVIIFGFMDDKNSLNKLTTQLGWTSISAVKNNRLVSDISADLMFRPGPRIADGLEKIYKHIYNE